MFKDPFHWFPNQNFSTLFLVVLVGVHFSDYAIPKILASRRTGKSVSAQDRGSYGIIHITVILALSFTIVLRWRNIKVTPAWVQYAGLVFMVAGSILREWAIIKLGPFFSRVVEIETGHRVITDGPYRWIRHPAYTGMLMIYTGFALALGTWLGALATLVLVLAATMYRIKVEEQALIQTFGDEYSAYMKHTWRLFPGW
jgi:protein-S-isoprenylcysteine O-methyltransferase Ste14